MTLHTFNADVNATNSKGRDAGTQGRDLYRSPCVIAFAEFDARTVTLAPCSQSWTGRCVALAESQGLPLSPLSLQFCVPCIQKNQLPSHHHPTNIESNTNKLKPLLSAQLLFILRPSLS